MKTDKAFTLIRLIVVVMIIGILAAIAIPNFMDYQCKVKQSEAKQSLGTIAKNQEAYVVEFNKYVKSNKYTDRCCCGSKRYYTYSYSGVTATATATSMDKGSKGTAADNVSKFAWTIDEKLACTIDEKLTLTNTLNRPAAKRVVSLRRLLEQGEQPLWMSKPDACE